jgi:hypothetical protein
VNEEEKAARVEELLTEAIELSGGGDALVEAIMRSVPVQQVYNHFGGLIAERADRMRRLASEFGEIQGAGDAYLDVSKKARSISDRLMIDGDIRVSALFEKFGRHIHDLAKEKVEALQAKNEEIRQFEEDLDTEAPNEKPG